MARPYEIPAATGKRRGGLVVLIIILLLVLAGARGIAGYILDYHWWREMRQVDTWLSLLGYQVTPFLAAVVVFFGVLFTTHARGMKFGGARLSRYPVYAKISTLALFLISLVLAGAVVDTWTVVRYFGGMGIPPEAAGWRDPVFGHSLKFYLFDLPFYSLLLRFVLVLVIASAVLYWAAARLWQLRDLFDARRAGEFSIDVSQFFHGALESRFLRALGALFLLAVAAQLFMGRYEMLWNDHGFLTGMDWLDENVTIPLQWLMIVTCFVTAVLLAFGRWRAVFLVAGAIVLRVAIPAGVGAVYVRPNEISIEKPYIQRHIQATRAAFGLDRRVRAVDYKAKLESRFDPAKNQAVLSNIRLWDWQAFHDTVTQIQSLRPYYRFADTDVDRYMIDGQLRQVLLTPRELDINLLPEAARSRWPNTHFVYTHGYGLVFAEANRITPDGLPVLFIQDAPPVVKTPSLKLTRPELYYSEVQHEPVFVHTAQAEFNYPSGADNVFTRYQGNGGFGVSSLGMRLAAAVSYGDPNILLTGYLTGESRMMVRRTIGERL